MVNGSISACQFSLYFMKAKAQMNSFKCNQLWGGKLKGHGKNLNTRFVMNIFLKKWRENPYKGPFSRYLSAVKTKLYYHFKKYVEPPCTKEWTAPQVFAQRFPWQQFRQKNGCFVSYLWQTGTNKQLNYSLHHCYSKLLIYRLQDHGKKALLA